MSKSKSKAEEALQFLDDLDQLADDFPEEFFMKKVLPELLKSVGGDSYPERRDELVRILDVDLSWHMHAVSDGERRTRSTLRLRPADGSPEIVQEEARVQDLSGFQVGTSTTALTLSVYF